MNGKKNKNGIDGGWWCAWRVIKPNTHTHTHILLFDVFGQRQNIQYSDQ